jgi:hypothetical protein
LEEAVLGLLLSLHLMSARTDKMQQYSDQQQFSSQQQRYSQQQYPSQPQYSPPQQVPQYTAVQTDYRQSQFDPNAKHHEGATVAQLYQDEEDRRVSVTTSKGRPKPNYRPVSLQWWYIGFLIGVFLGLGCAVVYADLKLRGSDSTATVDARSLDHDEAWLLYARGLEGELYGRQDGAAPTTPPAADAQPTDPAGVPVGGETPVNGEPPAIETPAPEVGRLTSALVEVTTEVTETAPGTTETLVTNTVIVIPGDVTLTSTSTISEVVSFSTDAGSGSEPGSTFTFTLQPSSEVVFTSTVTEAVSSTQALTIERTIPPSAYVRIGVTTVFSTFTVNSAGQKIEAATTRLETVEVGGTVVQSVETVPPTAIVVIGPDGLPTTSTSTPAPITHVTSVPPTKTVITNVSRPTSTGDKIIVEATRFELTSTKYFIGKFLPPLVAVVLALAVRAIDQTAKLYQPFAALAHPLGATGRDSLNLHFDGWLGFWRPFTMVSKGHPVPLLTSVAVWLSIPLAPLSAEAIGLKIHGRCHKNSIQGCALNLGVSSLEAYVLVGVLGLLALLLVGLLVAVSRRWKTGVFADPWCAAGAAALVRNPDVRSLGAPDFRAVKTAIADKQFTLGWFRNHEGREEYGLVLCDEAGRSLRGARREQEGSDMMVQTAYAEGMRYHGDGGARMVRRPPVTFVSLTFWWRLLFLIYLVALMGLVIYYQLGIKVPEEFRRFVEGQDFGMRFISSALGMVVIMCWDAIYCSKLHCFLGQGPSADIFQASPSSLHTDAWPTVPRARADLSSPSGRRTP